jgi:hypothetical protein
MTLGELFSPPHETTCALYDMFLKDSQSFWYDLKDEQLPINDDNSLRIELDWQNGSTCLAFCAVSRKESGETEKIVGKMCLIF